MANLMHFVFGANVKQTVIRLPHITLCVQGTASENLPAVLRRSYPNALRCHLDIHFVILNIFHSHAVVE